MLRWGSCCLGMPKAAGVWSKLSLLPLGADCCRAPHPGILPPPSYASPDPALDSTACQPLSYPSLPPSCKGLFDRKIHLCICGWSLISHSTSEGLGRAQPHYSVVPSLWWLGCRNFCFKRVADEKSQEKDTARCLLWTLPKQEWVWWNRQSLFP